MYTIQFLLTNLTIVNNVNIKFMTILYCRIYENANTMILVKILLSIMQKRYKIS